MAMMMIMIELLTVIKDYEECFMLIITLNPEHQLPMEDIDIILPPLFFFYQIQTARTERLKNLSKNRQI